MRYLLYERVSTEEQDTETQNNLCRNLIGSREDGEIIVFSDPDHSTSLPMDTRPGLQSMLFSLKKGDVVVVYDIDRLGRDIIEGITIRNLIKKKGAVLTSVTDPHCDNDFILDIKMVFAQEEKRKIIQRTKDKLKEKQRRMERVGTTWYGYELDETNIQTQRERARSFNKPYKLIPNSKEQEQLELMIKLKNQGYSYGEIVLELESKGHMNRKGNRLGKSTVFRVLKRLESQHPSPNLVTNK